ncbi:MAG: glycosyltransferase family 4 protein [Candidatus Odinarchaeia archaeon]
MRILQVSAYPPGRYGGSERFAMQLSKHLVERGHQVDLLTSNLDGKKSYEEIDGVNVYRCLCLKNIWNVNPLTFIFKRLLKEAHKYDVIHTHGYIFFTSNQVAMAKKIKKYNHVLHLHGGLIPQPGRFAEKKLTIKKWLYDPTLGRFTLHNADIIASVSKKDIVDSMRIFRISKERFIWVPPAVDGDFINNRLEENSNGVRNITFIGRLEIWKGIDLFIKAAKLILNQNNNGNKLKFTVVGDGSLRNKMAKEAKNLPINFVGVIPHKKIPEVLKRTDLLFLPSRLEGLPTVCIEAAANSVPVVASDVGGTREIIKHGFNGFIFNQPDLYKAVDYILKIVNSPDLGLKMGLNGLQLVKRHFIWPKIIDKIERIYEKLA